MNTTPRSQHVGAWMVAFRHELDRTLPQCLAEGWSYRLDPRTCMVYLLDPEGKGRVAVALPEGHTAKLPAEVGRVLCRTCTQLAHEAGMEPVAA